MFASRSDDVCQNYKLSHVVGFSFFSTLIISVGRSQRLFRALLNNHWEADGAVKSKQLYKWIKRQFVYVRQATLKHLNYLKLLPEATTAKKCTLHVGLHKISTPVFKFLPSSKSEETRVITTHDSSLAALHCPKKVSHYADNNWCWQSMMSEIELQSNYTSIFIIVTVCNYVLADLV